ncbi:hypothetical protein IC575_025611 [Cucumis melo]
MSTGTMSSFLSDFDETDAMFLEFTEDLNNPTGGSSLMGDNSVLLNHIRLLGDMQIIDSCSWSARFTPIRGFQCR